MTFYPYEFSPKIRTLPGEDHVNGGLARRAVGGALLAAGLALGTALPASAQSLQPGCWNRTYSLDHLAAHPDQHIARIRLLLEPDGYGTLMGGLTIWTAGQGHAAREGRGNQRFDSALSCWTDGGAEFCGIDCDGGWAKMVVKGETLTMTTDRMWVGESEECGGPMDLAEKPDTPVTYRLDKAPLGVCQDD